MVGVLYFPESIADREFHTSVGCEYGRVRLTESGEIAPVEQDVEWLGQFPMKFGVLVNIDSSEECSVEKAPDMLGCPPVGWVCRFKSGTDVEVAQAFG